MAVREKQETKYGKAQTHTCATAKNSYPAFLMTFSCVAAGMKNASDGAHAAGLRFSIYNTMRELSNRCRELQALVVLNETLVPANGKYSGKVA